MHLWTHDLIKKSETRTGKNTASSTRGADQIGQMQVEESKYTYNPTQKTPNGSKTST